ncbi:acyltransferase [Rhizobium sp. BK602]|uniref:acyltransferase family protein n=1 Tax=Rhizobium sp. BK602 TaxID=2586986 RepID=UPI001610B300|nr:acyltransferase [Rhizobium sp. BK602]
MRIGNDAISASAAASQKIISLEAMRGIASLIVLFHHFCLAFLPSVKDAYPRGLAGTPIAWIMRGESAVIFFFVLSGFVLTLKFYQRPDHGALLLSAIKRLPRLMGPAAISIVGGFVVLLLHWNYNEQAAAITGSEWLRTFGNAHFPRGFEPTIASMFEQFVLVFLLPDHFWYNSNLWTMPLEYYGSLLVFLLCGLAMRRSPVMRHILAIGSAFLVWKLYNDLLPFVAGTYLALIFASTGPRSSSNAWIGMAIASCSAVLLGSVEQHWQIVGSLGLIACLIYFPGLAQCLSGTFGRLLGRFSFPLYLVHFLVIASVSSYGFKAVYGWTESYTVSVAVAGAITLLASFAAALPMLIFDTRWVALVNFVFIRLSAHLLAMVKRITKGPRPVRSSVPELPTGDVDG